MISEICVRLGATLLGDTAPDGRKHWRSTYWDRERIASTPRLAKHFAHHDEVVAELFDDLDPPLSILDIATGTGKFAAQAAIRWPRSSLTVLDISPNAIERARRLPELAHATFLVEDAWGTAVNPADLVLCFDAIHHLGLIDHVFGMLGQLVGSGGVLAGNIWTSDHFHEFGRFRHGRFGHLRNSANFLQEAINVRIFGNTPSAVYRTHLVSYATAERLLREHFESVTVVRTRYHLVFTARQ